MFGQNGTEVMKNKNYTFAGKLLLTEIVWVLENQEELEQNNQSMKI